MARVKSLAEIAELAECGKRMWDVINQALTDFGAYELRTSWAAFRLSDGKWDGNIYDSLPTAKRFTDQWTHCYYSFLAAPGGISQRDCEIFLDVHRQARAVNAAQTDPNRQIIMPFGAGDTFRKAQDGNL